MNKELIPNNEIFVDIIEYKGLYQISTLGRVKSLPRKENHFKERILTTRLDKGGYPITYLKYMGKGKILKLHVEIAKAFIPNPNNLKVINHIDGNKNNYKISNLEWVTQQENVNHAKKMGLYASKERNPSAKLNDNIVKEIREFYKNNDCTYTDLIKKYKVCFTTISKVILNKSWIDNNYYPISKKINNGEKNSFSKLTKKEVLEIRRLKDTLTPFELSEKFKIARATVYGILLRNSWKDI
jgi:hypothetical protein